MGCASSVHAIGRKKKKYIPIVAIFVPNMPIPAQSDLQRILRGLVPKDLADKMTSIRNQIVLVAEDTGGSAINLLQRALEDYLPLLLGLTKKVRDLEFKWRNFDGGQREVYAETSWFEILSVIHMMAMLMLAEANLSLMPEDRDSCESVLSPDCMRNAVDLLLKAAGYLEFCIRDVLARLPPETKNTLPNDLQEGVLEAILIQALGQGTEIQLGLAVESQNATLSVKRRLACEQLSYFGQAYYCLSTSVSQGNGNKNLLFLKWKYLEAKAAAYYYHGLILDKGTEPSCNVDALSCFLAAEEFLAESKKSFLNFCLASPVTRAPPSWGAMKHLNKKIPETAWRKSQMFGYLLDQDNGLQTLPDLPEFQLSLKPDFYELPEIDSAWDTEKWELPSQTLKEQLKDSEDELETV